MGQHLMTDEVGVRFMVNALGALTLVPIDLLHLLVFVLAAMATSPLGDPA